MNVGGNFRCFLMKPNDPLSASPIADDETSNYVTIDWQKSQSLEGNATLVGDQDNGATPHAVLPTSATIDTRRTCSRAEWALSIKLDR